MISKGKFVELFNELEKDDEKLNVFALAVQEYSDCNTIISNGLHREYIEMMELLIGDEYKTLSYWLYDCDRKGKITQDGKEHYINTIEDVYDYVKKGD